ncbi:hypothetical protein [Paraurantiacibacter namhicola]|uniref:Uncharacterized protein n=1 Tax=Paraurantiacibacter namhicola TaxID=645517 RepID=A0A1C7D5H6_9SPHN|nr:hypothetical protein [Paraurantiacibacter namhicola]ANU06553.1 hypothetical protein A6F65_00226 [Paraurantiacibacter namhicola]
MANTLWHAKQTGQVAQGFDGAEGSDRTKPLTKRMSDHIAFALLVYTGLNIFVTMEAIKGTNGSILPYFGLVVLVAAIIPACRKLESRWERLTTTGAEDAQLTGLFRRDVLALWACAIGLPFALTGLHGLLA